MRVSIGGFYLEYAIPNFQDGYIKGSSAQVEYGDLLIVLLIQPVCQGCRRRFIDDPLDVQSCDLAGILCGLALAVVEIGRHGNDRICHWPTQMRLGCFLDIGQYIGRYFGRAVEFSLDANVCISVGRLFNAVGKYLEILLNFRRIILPTNEPLNSKYGVFRIGHRLALGDLSDQPFALIRNTDHGRGCPASLFVRDDVSIFTLENRNARVGGSKVDSNSFPHSEHLPCA